MPDTLCPYCGEPLEFQVEPLDGSQDYIEDCSVCCQPIQVSVQIRKGQVEAITVSRANA